MRQIVLIVALLAGLTRVVSAEADHDVWLTNAVPLPVSGNVNSNLFATLRADSVSGQLQVTWRANNSLDGAKVTLFASPGPPGHWPARDWRSRAMHRHGSVWQANIPVESVDIPIAYFAAVSSADSTNVSPVRICHPRRIGLEEPSKFFWPFVEGFEQGLESWRAVQSEAALRTSPVAKNGRNALAVTIPANKRSVAVATTRVPGWLIEERAAKGIAFWARTTASPGQLRCAFIANAFGTNQLADAHSKTFEITRAWTRFAIPFSEYPHLLVADLDLITFEWIGSPGTEFLLDDIYLLGRWRFE